MLAKVTSKNIPIAFKIKVTNTNCQVLIFDSPIIVMPISSGNGEAIIKAPTRGNNHEKYGLKTFLIQDPQSC